MQFPKKYCENCGKELILKVTRDIKRKRFCSHKCTRSFITKQLWQNDNFKHKMKNVCSGPNPAKGHHGVNHPNFGGKQSTPEIAKKKSIAMCKHYQNGTIENEKHHKHGYFEHKKSGRVYYRSSYELIFLFQSCENPLIEKIKSTPFIIPYENKNYVPDFLINDKYLIEIKPQKLVALNENKFNAARKFCEDNNLIFKIITEKELIMKEVL